MNGKNSSDSNLTGMIKSKSTNIFLNTIIVLLGLIVLFLLYSLVTKLNPGTSDITEDEKNKASLIVQLEVLNGCGMPGAAEKFTDYLRSKNFDVVHTGNYRSFDIDNTMVIDRAGNKANAEKVADALGIEKKFIIQQINNDYFLDVSLVIGKDFNQLNPNK
ncbi:MAG: LytR C-terminal domain-containing protein [Ignavibacteriales bacterium]|nr:MAG: LytR C-terminal domain-containing protein [Ignavibacteriales bacterium]